MTPSPHREPGLPDDLPPDDPSLPGNLPPDDPLPDPNQPPDDPPAHDPTPPAPDPRLPGVRYAFHLAVADRRAYSHHHPAGAFLALTCHPFPVPQPARSGPACVATKQSTRNHHGKRIFIEPALRRRRASARIGRRGGVLGRSDRGRGDRRRAVAGAVCRRHRPGLPVRVAVGG
ncbi:hypothetical protein G6F57_020893 [Rhizopus arrhizus]|nr:hypothetical protein G6F57_020893 [Rhizopus arrhizus]